jgi:hypothetical protein
MRKQRVHRSDAAPPAGSAAIVDIEACAVAPSHRTERCIHEHQH